mgnify:CR=1 FL=1
MSRLTLLLLVVVLVLTACGGSAPREFQRYTSQDAINAFVAAGLEAESPTPIDPNEETLLPKTFVEGQRFLITSLGEDRGGRVFSFENEKELNAIKDYYEAFSGLFGSWVFVEANLVVQIGNDLPKAKAEQYERALAALDDRQSSPWQWVFV